MRFMSETNAPGPFIIYAPDMHFSLFAHIERHKRGDDICQLREQFVRLCQLADDGGMRAIWTGEHHGMNFTIAPNPFTLLADIAHRTKHLRLGTATIVAPFWHPLKLAGEIAMTDMLTGGRLEVGIARGAYIYATHPKIAPRASARRFEVAARYADRLPAACAPHKPP